MIKDILQKNRVGLGLGLIFLLVNQSFAIPPRPNSILHLAFSGDASQIQYIKNYGNASGLQVKRMDISTGAEGASTEMANRGVRMLGFTPDGFKVAMLGTKGLSILHNKTGKVLRTLKVPSLPWPQQYASNSAITNKSGTAQLFHSANKRALNVIHTGNGRVLVNITLETGTLRGMGLSQDGRIVSYVMARSATESHLYLYDTYQKKVTKSLAVPTLGGYGVEINTVAFSPDGKQLVVADQLVDLVKDKVTKISRTDNRIPVIFTPNGRYVLVSANSGQLLRYDLRTHQKHGINLGLPARCWVSKAVDISPNEKWIAFGSHCSRVKGIAPVISILNAADGSFSRSLTVAP